MNQTYKYKINGQRKTKYQIFLKIIANEKNNI